MAEKSELTVVSISNNLLTIYWCLINLENVRTRKSFVGKSGIRSQTLVMCEKCNFDTIIIIINVMCYGYVLLQKNKIFFFTTQ